MEAQNEVGILYICGTPIGNLEDATIRLVKTLRRVDCIVCEDTRHTARLLKRYKIRTRLLSYHEHSPREREDYILELLEGGQSLALVSDAGMPGISDPGARLIRRAREAGVPLESVPGPTALAAAYSLAGLDQTPFVFGGFLDRKAGRRRECLEAMKAVGLPLIIYEAPHRLLATLESLAESYGPGHHILVARELTKLHEESLWAGIASHQEQFRAHEPRGEFCLVIPAPPADAGEPPELEEIAAEVRQLMAEGLAKKEALKMKAREYGVARSDLYRCLIEMREH